MSLYDTTFITSSTTGASTLSNDEVERMVEDAQKFAEEDGKKREAVDVKNQADSMVYQADKQLKEFGDKVPADVKTKVEAKITSLKDASAADDVEAMKKAMEELQTELMAVGQAVYSQGGAPGAGPEAAPGAEGAPGAGKGKDDGNVVDAEFTDSK